jgi:hypothetical protein
MSERSIYLRDQAAKCEWHAKNLSDSETQRRLRELAFEYMVEATAIEAREGTTRSLPPSLWNDLPTDAKPARDFRVSSPKPH